MSWGSAWREGGGGRERGEGRREGGREEGGERRKEREGGRRRGEGEGEKEMQETINSSKVFIRDEASKVQYLQYCMQRTRW